MNLLWPFMLLLSFEHHKNRSIDRSMYGEGGVQRRKICQTSKTVLIPSPDNGVNGTGISVWRDGRYNGWDARLSKLSAPRSTVGGVTRPYWVFQLLDHPKTTRSHKFQYIVECFFTPITALLGKPFVIKNTEFSIRSSRCKRKHEKQTQLLVSSIIILK